MKTRIENWHRVITWSFSDSRSSLYHNPEGDRKAPPDLLATAMTIIVERVSGEEMDCVFDATGVKMRKYETREHVGEERKKRVYTELNAARVADKRVFHAADVLDGRAHEYSGSEEMLTDINTPIRKLFADSGYADSNAL